MSMHRARINILILAAVLVLSWGATALAADHQEEFQKTLPLRSEGTFSLKNVNGEVVVTTWKEEKVEIKALKKTKKAAENLQKVTIEVSTAADSVSVETVYPKAKNTGVSVDYEVKVPEGVRLAEIHTVNGGLILSGPFGQASASAVNGTVHIENATGELDLETTNGNVKALDVGGKIVARSTNGSIHVSLQEINADLDARTTNGSISFDFPVTLQSLEKSKHRLQGRIGQGGPLISLKAVNGSIRLTR
jgi:DUF4097 and DUF4098 domain-containing protein YvlB